MASWRRSAAARLWTKRRLETNGRHGEPHLAPSSLAPCRRESSRHSSRKHEPSGRLTFHSCGSVSLPEIKFNMRERQKSANTQHPTSDGTKTRQTLSSSATLNRCRATSGGLPGHMATWLALARFELFDDPPWLGSLMRTRNIFARLSC